MQYYWVEVCGRYLRAHPKYAASLEAWERVVSTSGTRAGARVQITYLIKLTLSFAITSVMP